MPAALRKQVGSRGVTVKDPAGAGRRVVWTEDGRLLVVGGDQDETPARRRDEVLVQRTGQLMYELLTMYPAISGLRPEYGWESSYGETADGLMYIGPHRNYPRHLFALGGAGDSLTGAFLAARILARALQEQAREGRSRSSGGRDERRRRDPGRSARVRAAPRRHRDRCSAARSPSTPRSGHRSGCAISPPARWAATARWTSGSPKRRRRVPCSAPSWRVNLRLPDRAIGSSPDHARAVAGLVRRARPRAVAVPYWSDRHPDHVRGQRAAHRRACSTPACGAIDAPRRRLEAGVGLLLLHQRSRRAVVRRST